MSPDLVDSLNTVPVASPSPVSLTHSVSIIGSVEPDKEINDSHVPGTTRKRDRDDDSRRAALKCQREKKRRGDMNKGFSDLVSTLEKIDANSKADAVIQEPTLLSSSSTSSLNRLNRVEVISRAAVVLDQVHKENEDHKDQIKELNAKLEAATNEKNQALALLASKSCASASTGLQVCQQGITSSSLQSLIQPQIPPTTNLAQVFMLSRLLSAPAQKTNSQLTTPPMSADTAGAVSHLVIQKALDGLSSRHYTV